jgi:hypothetical protein
MSIHFSSQSNEWATPTDFFTKLNREFLFTLDPCATPENAKCAKYFTEADDGLAQSWDNERVFCNPPYGRQIKEWVKKASEARGGGCSFTDSSTYRHQLLSRLYIQLKGSDSLFTWALKVWRFKKLSTVSLNGGYF